MSKSQKNLGKLKTTELLDKLDSFKGKENLPDEFYEILDELREREPFWDIFADDSEEAIPNLLERVKELESKFDNHIHNECGVVFIKN